MIFQDLLRHFKKKTKLPSAVDIVMRSTLLALESGDIVVYRHPEHIPMEGHEHLRKVLQAMFPKHKVLVIDGGASLDAIRPTRDDTKSPV